MSNNAQEAEVLSIQDGASIRKGPSDVEKQIAINRAKKEKLANERNARNADILRTLRANSQRKGPRN